MRHPHAEPGRPLTDRPFGRPATPVRTVLLLAGLLLTAVLVALASLVAAPAQAHDSLLGSRPAADAVLDEAPAEVRLTFSADQLAVGTAVTVTGPAGQGWAEGEVQVEGPEVSRRLRAGMVDGTYTVDWRSVSGDGHAQSGTYEFSLDLPAAPAEPESVPTPTASPTVDIDADADPAERDADADADADAAEPNADGPDAEDAGDRDATVAEPWWLLAGAVVVLAVGGVVWAVRRRSAE